LGRPQLATSATQPSCSGSSANPGNSDHDTGTQRLRGCANDPVSGPNAGGPPIVGPGVSAGGKRGPNEQAASVATTIASPHSLRKRCLMGLILLEALGAAVILVAIVWWTMFSGRRGGEIAHDDDAQGDDDNAPKPPRK